MRFAEWQVIYPELADVTLAEIAGCGSKAHLERTGKTDDELLVALIRLGHAGDEDAFLTALMILMPRIQYVVSRWTTNEANRAGPMQFVGSSFDDYAVGAAYEILCSWNLQTHPRHIGRVFLAKLRRDVGRIYRRDAQLWSEEQSDWVVRYDRFADFGDGYQTDQAVVEDEALYRVAVDELFSQDCFGKCPKTKALLYETLINDASLADASKTVGLSAALGRQRVHRARATLRELAKAA